MEDKTIWQLILLGALAISGIIGIQSYWVLNTWNAHEEEFDSSVRIALRKATEELAALDSISLPDRDLIKRRTSNYYVVNYNNVIDPNNLEFILQKTLEKFNINSDFEYGIFDCSSDEMVYGDFCSISENYENTPDNISIQLPKYDEFIYYFGIRFLGKSANIMTKMQLSIIFTIILLLAIIFFLYAMYIILRQKRLSEMQKDFINNMTHEFKTPISTIKISANVFASDPTIQQNERLSKYAGIIQEQNQRLNNQVEKVLQIAKMEQDNFKLNFEKINIHELLEDIIESTSLKVEEKNGNIIAELNANQPIINADRLHLTNIIYNLLDNSMKYCKDSPNITMRTSDTSKGIQLSIKDEGIGISKEYQNKIFNKFFRVPTGNVHDVKGFGLGLFYVKNIVDAHGWKINIKSEKDQYTEIKIEID